MEKHIRSNWGFIIPIELRKFVFGNSRTQKNGSPSQVLITVPSGNQTRPLHRWFSQPEFSIELGDFPSLMTLVGIHKNMQKHRKHIGKPYNPVEDMAWSHDKSVWIPIQNDLASHCTALMVLPSTLIRQESLRPMETSAAVSQSAGRSPSQLMVYIEIDMQLIWLNMVYHGLIVFNMV